MVDVKRCRHCGKNKMNRARGLCFACSRVPEIRAMYPTTSKYARRGVAYTGWTLAEPTPTRAAPGTSAKVEVLSQRAERGERLWHDQDARVEL